MDHSSRPDLISVSSREPPTARRSAIAASVMRRRRTGRPAHPEITMHAFPLEGYLSLIERDDWAGVAALMSRSAGNWSKQEPS